MTTVQIGQRAERVVAQYLQGAGYLVVDMNWRTRYCEIDIIAIKDMVVQFVEVKYRATSNQGSGLDYITPKKLQQMQFAAELWVVKHSWRGEYRLCAVEVRGPRFTLGDLVEL